MKPFTDEEMKKIIYELDEHARDCNCHEYGLPTYDNEKMKDMIAIIDHHVNHRTENEG